MWEAQYRIMGTGEVAVSRKIFWKCGYVEVRLENRLYETEDKLNDSLIKMQGLYEKHSAQLDAILAAKDKIKHDRQVNPFNSALFVKKAAGDASKYRKQRGRPINLWDSVRKAVLKARSTQQMHECLYSDDDVTIEMMGKSDHKVGRPVRDNSQNMSKAERQRQHQQNQSKQNQ